MKGVASTRIPNVHPMPAAVMASYAYPLRGKSSKGSEERRDRPVRLSAAPRSRKKIGGMWKREQIMLARADERAPLREKGMSRIPASRTDTADTVWKRCGIATTTTLKGDPTRKVVISIPTHGLLRIKRQGNTGSMYDVARSVRYHSHIKKVIQHSPDKVSMEMVAPDDQVKSMVVSCKAATSSRDALNRRPAPRKSSRRILCQARAWLALNSGASVPDEVVPNLTGMETARRTTATIPAGTLHTSAYVDALKRGIHFR